MKHVSVFLIGLLFGLGLVISGMINPAKVLGFLDISGDWDASLAFVMGGAVLVNLIGYRVVTRRSHPLFESSFAIPTRSGIDIQLIAGSALFGMGWGLVGFCPGPALASLGAAPQQSVAFVGAMLIGMLATRSINAGGLRPRSVS